MKQAFIIDGIRTPIGNFGGTLSTIRTDDLAALVLKELIKRNPSIDTKQIGDVNMGCANQAGENKRKLARIASFLDVLPYSCSGENVNRFEVSHGEIKEVEQASIPINFGPTGQA